VSELALIGAALGVVFAAAFPLFGVRRITTYTPSVMAAGLVAFFVVPKAVLIAWIGTDHPEVAGRLLRGGSASALMTGLLISMVGFAFFSLGVITVSRAPRFGFLPVLKRPFSVGPRFARNFGTAMTFIALVAGVIFLINSGGFDGPSKRFAESDEGVNSRIFSSNYLLFRLSLLSRVTLWACVVWSERVRAAGQLRAAARLKNLAIANALIAVAITYFSDNRAGIALVIIDWVIVSQVYLPRRQGSRLRYGLMALSALGVSTILLGQRSQRSPAEALQGMFLSRDLVDFSKIGMIAERDFRTSGHSLWHWTLGAMPDGFLVEQNAWRRLPLEVWQGAYQTPFVNGLPPSLIGELYASFRWVGVIVGMYLFGLIVKKVHLFADLELSRRTLAGPIGLMVLTRLVVFGLSSDFGVGVTKSMLDAVPLAFFLILASRRVKTQAVEPDRQRPQLAAVR